MTITITSTTPVCDTAGAAEGALACSKSAARTACSCFRLANSSLSLEACTSSSQVIPACRGIALPKCQLS